MTTRNTFRLGLSIGAFLLLYVGTSAAPESEQITIGYGFPSRQVARVTEFRTAPEREAPFVGRYHTLRLTLNTGEMSPSENGASAGSIQPRAQVTPTVRGQGADSNRTGPTETVFRLVAWGASLAALSLLGFGVYTILRGRVRNYLGRLRNRRLHRQRGRGRGRKNEEK